MKHKDPIASLPQQKPETPEADLLRQLMPAALERARLLASQGATVGAGSTLGKAASPWFVLSNVAGVRIVQGRIGGWLADILLAEVPAGLPDAFGTPVASPLPDRDSALEAAVTMLAMAALAEPADTRQAPLPDPVLVLHGVFVTVPRVLLDACDAERSGGAGEAPNRPRARAELDRFVSDICPAGPLTAKHLEELGEAGRARLYDAACAALSAGILIHPAPDPGSPAQAPIGVH